jgi:phosphatidate phosphatase LPIN
MTDLVDQMFPPIHRKWAPEFTDVNFWRDPMPKYDFPELAPPSPPSPALSARSDASMQSGLSRLRNFSLRPQAQQFVPPSTSTHQVHQRTQSLRGRDGSRNNDLTNTTGHARHTSAGGYLGDGMAIPRKHGSSRSPDAEDRKAMNRLSGSMPGSYEEFRLDEDDEEEEDEEDDYDDEYEDEEGEGEYDEEEEYDENGDEEDGVHHNDGLDHHDFNDELLATGEMDHIPFL